MKVKELLENVPGTFNYLEKYNNEILKNKVHVWDTKKEKRVDLFESMDKDVNNYNLNGENWTLAIYV